MCDVSSMLLSSMRSQTLHLAGYFPMRRSAGKTEADDDDEERGLARLLLDAAIDADSASRAAANAPCLLE